MKAGILCPISALPSSYGVGDFGKNAYTFVDQLKKSDVKIWQILPLNPLAYGNSPYQPYSSYAGDELYIDLEDLVNDGLLEKGELKTFNKQAETVEYEAVRAHKEDLLRLAYKRFEFNDDFKQFVENNKWVEGYALFRTFKLTNEGKPWTEWHEEYKEFPKHQSFELLPFEKEINYQEFLQYYFFKQWYALKDYANSKGVEIIGDIPIYVAYDSSDVWGQPELFQLDPEVKPTAVAGVPPDGFSADGQLWGNPLYDWKKHKETGYAWWIQRIAYCKKAYDVVRIDHFRGFDEYFSIPYGDTTARNGHWEKGPGYDLFKTVEESLGKINVIAEDLGYLTDTVKQMVADCGYPGMKVFEFAFDSRDSSGTSNYLPHNYTENSVVYTGTHDNETMIGWLKNILPEERQTLKDYLHYDGDDDAVLVDMSIDCIMASVSDKCIVPMQDYLKLDNTARMNKPNTLGNNWMWRLDKNAFNDSLKERMRDITVKTNRI